MTVSGFRFLWPCVMNVRWRERNQQDVTNPMFIIKLLSQHVSGIIIPIIRRTRPCTTAYGVLHWLCWLWLCGAASWAVCTVLLFDSNCTTCGSTRSCSPDDGHNDARNMLRSKFDNKHRISCILLVSLSLPYNDCFLTFTCRTYSE